MDITSPNSDSDNETGSQDTPLVTYSSTFKPSLKPQIIAALVVSIGTFSLGTVLGWSSPALSNLQNDGRLGEVSEEMSSWIGSIVNLGAMFTCVGERLAAGRIGRKLTLILVSCPFVFGWVLIATSTSFAMILTGRFVTGFCGAFFTLIGPMYISETADPRIRGTLSSAAILSLVTGILFTYIVGSFVSWVWLSLISAVFPAIFLCCMIFMPESPVYLVSKGESAKAIQSLQWLQGAVRSSQVEGDLLKIEDSFSSGQSGPENILSPHIFQPILICLMLMLFQQFGGINAVVFYSKDIFHDSGTEIDPNLASILVGATQVTMSIVSTYMIDKVGRKIMLIVSDAGMAISLFTLATFFYLEKQNGGLAPAHLGWLPLASLIFYMITYNIGLGSLPWVILAEISPASMKESVSIVASTFCWTLGFIVTKYFKSFSGWLGTYATFLIFGIISTFGSLFAALVIPETKGKSLSEIQALFRNRN